MEHQDPAWQQQRAREELLLRFLKAYDEGNLEVFGAILQQAENDPELDTLIWTVFPTYLREEGIHPASEEEKERLFAILQQPIPPAQERSEPLPLTLADVAAKIQVELTLHRAEYTNPHVIQVALNTLVQSHDPLPDPIDLRTIQAILSQHRLTVPSSFYDIFLETARQLREKRSTQQ
jgi:hypothetical protein